MINGKRVDYYVGNPSVYIIDLRNHNSYKKSHIKGSINIEYDKIMAFINDKNGYYARNMNSSYKDSEMGIFYEHNKIFIFYCDRGMQSLKLCDRLSKMGYHVKSLVGGIYGYSGTMLEKI